MTTQPARVFSYWEGPKPPWIQLCLETLQHNIPGVEILTRRQWGEIHDNRDVPVSVLSKQRPNVRSDFIRGYLLSILGGVWIDADCIAMRDVRPICDHLEHADFVAYRVGRPQPQVCSALIASNPGGRVISQFYRSCVKKLNDCDCKLPGLDLGPRLLRSAIWQNHRLKDHTGNITGLPDPPTTHFIPMDLVHPIHWKRNWRHRMPQGDWRLNPSAYCYMLSHGALSYMRKWSREQILRSNTLVGVMFRLALGIEQEPS